MAEPPGIPGKGEGRQTRERRLTLRDYYTPWELVLTLADTVSRGGNLLLNIGATADGRILTIQEEQLTEMGAWLKVNGQAIYGTKPWRRSCQWTPGDRPKIDYDKDWRVKYDIREIAGRPQSGKAAVEAFFTSTEEALYAILPHWPDGELDLRDVKLPPHAEVRMLGVNQRLRWRAVNGGVAVYVPPLNVEQLPCRYAYVLKLPGAR